MKLKVKHAVKYKRCEGRKVAINKGKGLYFDLIRAGVNASERDLAIMMYILGNRHLCRLLNKGVDNPLA